MFTTAKTITCTEKSIPADAHTEAAIEPAARSIKQKLLDSISITNIVHGREVNPSTYYLASEDIKDGYTFAWVENVDLDWCSEFGSIAIKPSFGGLVRLR